MIEHLGYIFEKISTLHLNVLLLLGLALFGGTIGGRVFQKLRIPQVVGYIAIGILAGQSGFKIIGNDIIQALQPFSHFALGLIGFMIGGELRKDVFRRYGKQFTTILFSEGITAFIIVFLLVGILGSFIFGGGWHYWALGLLLGAIASATAPAATTDVLWEYKSRGPLTSTVLGIVAMDDGLSLMLFAVASSIVAKLSGLTQGGLFYSITHPLYEIGAAIVVGIASGLCLVRMLKRYTENDRILAFALGAVLFVLGLSKAIHVDMLLSAMALGVIIVNKAPNISKQVFNLVASFSAPIYVLFFVLVGAKLDVHNLTIPVITIAGIYLFGRTLGKMTGATIGARISGAPKTVRKYLPFCLFSQAGVAIGLSIVAYHAFPGEIGNSIVIIITASTFIVQLLGPPCVKYAITKAEEVGLNITEDDLVRKIKMKEVLDEHFPSIYNDTPLDKILEVFKASPYLYYPVVDKSKVLKGAVTVESIRQAFSYTDLSGFLLAEDIMEPVSMKISDEATAIAVKDILERYNLNFLPVVNAKNQLVGCVGRRMLSKFISTKMIELEQKITQLDSQ